MKLQLARNALSNLLGALVPALVALGTVPLVVRGLGEAGYGLYSLVTAIVGYFAVIDINVTAGSVKFIAGFHARRDSASIGQTIRFGLIVYALLGAAGAVGLYAGAGFLVTEVFGVAPALAAEAVATLKLAALGFFIGQLQNYLQSVPQSLMRYDVASGIEMLFGVVVPLLTVLVLMRGHGLFEVILVRVAASALHCLVLWRSITRLLPGLALRRPGAAIRRALLGFSAWSFLSRFAALSYAHADKLIIGALAGVTELAWYTVAATLASRVLSLTYRLSGVLFPAASALAARGELARLDRLYLKATRYVVFLNGAILVLVAVFAHQILRYWMNPEFARHGALVLAVMACAQFIDSLTSLPSLVNDGMGHPRVSGIFAVARAGAGLLTVAAGTANWGIAGAAWGHLAASLVLAGAFIGFVHGRTVPTGLRGLLRRGYAPPLGGVLAIALCAGLAGRLYGNSAAGFVFLLAATGAMLFLHGVLFVIDKDDRDLAWRWMKACWRPVQGS
jgi:O-antigen/teichoic acid export membrane protein